MPAYMKFDGVDGEAKSTMPVDAFIFTPSDDQTRDSDHKDWINIESMSPPIYRSMDDEQRDLKIAGNDADATAGSVPTEEVTFNYTEIEWTY